MTACTTTSEAKVMRATTPIAQRNPRRSATA
jgi:hypothetical protein